MASQLDKWLETKNYFVRTKETPSPSHLLLNGYKGGKLYIPRSDEYEFLCQYTEEMNRGTKLYYVEQRPKTFKFMIDVDISDDHYWLDEEIAKLVGYIQKTVYAFFETSQIVVCCTSPAKVKPDGTHTGIHLIWPNLFITSDTALCIRRGVIQKLKEDAKEFKLVKSWEDIIDETIYTRNGYRMVGSDKLAIVKGSENEKKVPENRPLSLLFVMNSEGQLSENYYNRIKKDSKALILETSIRYVIDTYLDQGMYINKIPAWLEEDPLQRKAGIRTNSGTVISSKNHLIIENFIKHNLPKVYKGSVKAITKYPKESGYPDALLIKTTSKYCINIGRDHNSCGIYFYATPEGITQRCMCSCNKLDGRKTGLCMDFVSGLYPFDNNTRTVLFPELDKNLFETEQKKKKIIKTKQKLKQDTRHVPETKTNILKQRQSVCDKLFGQITGEYLN
jgi:hypothetical protein